MDSPDLYCRVFHIKMKALLSDMLDNGVLGVCIAYAYSVEFQQRGLPHMHAVFIMRPEDKPHSVAIIDQDAAAFKRLHKDFKGSTVTGIGFDRDRLAEAGITKADAFIAVSSGDNSNILAARVARENFGVKNVIARIYDPRRAEVYERLGIPTVATASWTADQILRHEIGRAHV